MTVDEIFEIVRSGKPYAIDDEGFLNAQLAVLDKLYEINHTKPSEQVKRRELYKDFFGKVGKNLYLELPFHANWGINTYWGDDCYANFNLTLVDDGDIIFGNSVLLAPGVTITTTGHVIEPSLRKKTYQFSERVVIDDNVWIGANSVIMPGVHIGENSVIGAGSVVTKDIPANVVAFGTPCRVIREINEYDRLYYRKGKKIEWENLK